MFNWKKIESGLLVAFDKKTKKETKFTVHSWPFGQIHQCKICVKYPEAKRDNGEVGIGLSPSKTQKEAFDKGIAWCENYANNGPPSSEQVFKNCYEHYPTLFQTRLEVINHLFFVIGGGYEWLDGSIVCTGPEDWKQNQEMIDFFLEELKKKGRLTKHEQEGLDSYLAIKARREKCTIGPVNDYKQKYDFYPISKGYSNIFHVPADLTKEWLGIVFEAAYALRDRSDNKNRQNKEFGAKLVEDLNKRFPR